MPSVSAIKKDINNINSPRIMDNHLGRGWKSVQLRKSS
jgi:hypothetical protein